MQILGVGCVGLMILSQVLHYREGTGFHPLPIAVMAALVAYNLIKLEHRIRAKAGSKTGPRQPD